MEYLSATRLPGNPLEELPRTTSPVFRDFDRFHHYDRPRSPFQLSTVCGQMNRTPGWLRLQCRVFHLPLAVLS